MVEETVTIQIPFQKLVIFIDIKILLMIGSVPILLCMRDRVKNDLYIYLQDRTINYNGKIQAVALENNCMVYRWGPGYIAYNMYT